MKKIRRIWQAATTTEKITLILCTIYVLSPIDFIPELLFSAFGLIDDATAVGIFIWTYRQIDKRLMPNPDLTNNFSASKNNVGNDDRSGKTVPKKAMS